MRLSVLESWLALLCGEVFVWAPDDTKGLSVFWSDYLEYHFPREVQEIRYAVRIVVDRCSPPKPG